MPVSIDNGSIYIHDSEIQNCKIKSCITESKDGYAFADIYNCTPDPQEIFLDKPIQAHIFHENDFFLFNVSVKSNSDETHTLDKSHIINLLRIDHMNEAEKYHISKLC